MPLFKALPMLMFFPLAAMASDDATDWQLRRMDWQQQVKDGQSMVIVNHYGDLRVRASPHHRIEVIGMIQEKANQLNTLVLTPKEEDGQWFLVVEYQGKTEDFSQIDRETQFDLTVLVPKNWDLSLETKSGLLEAKGLENNLHLRSTTGKIKFSNKGHVDAANHQGDISGALKAIDHSEPYSFVSVHGNVMVQIPHNADIKATLRTETTLATDFSIDIRYLDHAQKEGVALLGAGKHSLILDSRRGGVHLGRLPELYTQ